MGVYTDFTGRPTAKYVKNEKAFVKYLAKEYAQIGTVLQKGLEVNPNSPTTIRQIELMKQVQVLIKKMDKPMYEQINKYIKESYMDGKAFHMLSVGDANSMTEARGALSFNAVNRDRVEALTQDTYKDILLATKNTEKHIKKVIQDTVRDVAQYNALKNSNYTEQAEQLRQSLSGKGLSDRIKKDGFVGVVDKRGRKWDLTTYSNMVIKTKNNDAFKQGVMNRAEEEGMDLAVISDHSADDACSKWEGVIISMSGATEGYPTYAEARGSNQVFHPNCEHTIHPIRSVSDLHPDDIAESKAKAKQLEYKRLPKPVKPKVKPNTIKPLSPPVEPPKQSESLYELVKRTDTQFYGKVGATHYDNIHEKLKDSPVPIQKVWGKYEDKIIAIDMKKTSGGAYYSPSQRGVYMNLKKDSVGTHFTEPYQVTYHEFAHNIDFLVQAEFGGGRGGFSYMYKDNKFGKSLQKEFDDRIKELDKKMKADFKANKDNLDWLFTNGYLRDSEMNRLWYKEHPEEVALVKHTKAHTYSAFQKEIKSIPLMERGNLSDIVEGASNAKVQGGVGHGKSYWKSESNLPAEAFAEMIDSSVANKPALEQIKKYFPLSYQVFEEMLEVIIN